MTTQRQNSESGLAETLLRQPPPTPAPKPLESPLELARRSLHYLAILVRSWTPEMKQLRRDLNAWEAAVARTTITPALDLGDIALAEVYAKAARFDKFKDLALAMCSTPEGFMVDGKVYPTFEAAYDEAIEEAAAELRTSQAAKVDPLP